MKLPVEISGGAFDMLFSDGDLRKVKVAGKEIIQRFYFAVRDKDWLNVPHTLSGFKEEPDGYSYELSFNGGPVHFKVRITVTFSDNRLTLEACGKSLSSFLKNRIGFCVNLPSRLKKTPCKVLHTDGSRSLSSFPESISPHQPFKNICSIEWQAMEWAVGLSFEGDVFEMEDQRNWTDASYKIYSTPLDLPLPVAVGKDDAFYQKIVLTVSPGTASGVHPAGDQDKGAAGGMFAVPSVGISCPEDISILPFLQTRGKKPFISFLRVDFRFHDSQWRDAASRDLRKALDMNMKTGAVLYLGSDAERETDEFVKWLTSLPFRVAFHTITLLSYDSFVPGCEKMECASAILRRHFPGVPVGSGTDANFAQLNRNRPDPACLDFISYSIHPAEHASDPLSVVENIQGQADTVETAKSFSAGKDIHIASLSLFRRFNANNDFVLKSGTIPEYPFRGTGFEAGWFTGSLQRLIRAGASSIVCAVPLGPRSPLARVFRYLASDPPEGFYDYPNSDPEKYSILSWKSLNKQISVFANHTNTEIRLEHQNSEVKIGPGSVVRITSRIYS